MQTGAHSFAVLIMSVSRFLIMSVSMLRWETWIKKIYHIEMFMSSKTLSYF